ncbi:MAG: FtsW/RodA/SpoVE family cell cycle protein [Clostridium sp.]|nr:FtsW/RodA/SpoVE family cell cycle protein [Prevotella sp.]MCM1429598.1 FtsW/RodA/SpoVE family cell cycle protein [Clostridium sp.]MCM1476077.1 FtsW/RodA/SpoVE family cell cycle protein [Muribaculaceae bacterium]
MQKNPEEIIINETIDGQPIGDSPILNARRRRTPAAARVLTDEERAAKAEKTVRSRAKHDPYIWGIYIMLLLVSVVELFSASSTEVRDSNIYGPLLRHVMYLGAGFLIVIWLQNLHYGYFSRFSSFFALLSIGLLAFSTFFGTDINGAQRAISIPLVGTLQPAEILKIAMVIFLATILGRNQMPGGVSTKGILTVAIVVLFCAGLLWINGLTNAVILMVVSVSMFLVGGIQWKKLCAVGLSYLLIVGVVYIFKDNAEKASEFDRIAAEQTGSSPTGEVTAEKTIGRSKTHESRLDSYKKGVSPNDTITDKNRQVFYAKLAQANGGLIGRGPGNSRESARLPLAFSDYIYSIIVEDTGFVGGVLLLVLYLLLLGRAGAVAYKCSRALPAFLIIGCAVLIVSQALVHMAIVTGVAPVSGQPLPLISKGGTSILVMSAAIGVMLSVSRFAVKSKDKKEMAAELDILPADMQAANVSLEERK